MSWIIITKAHLADYLVGAQLDALSTAALGDGQADPFAAAMPDRCTYVRNRIAGRCQLSATAHAIPPELKTQACFLIIEAMQVRLMLELTDDQKTMIRRAYTDLDLAGTDDLPVSTPDDPIDAAVQSATKVQQVGKPTRNATRSKLSGL
jgi:hypothetical protein